MQPFDLASLLLEIYPMEIIEHRQKDLALNMFISALFIKGKN